MAIQKGIIKLKGAIGDISFGQGPDGFTARQKGSIDKNRIKNDPAFARTRENGSEFGRAGLGGKLLRTAFRPLIMDSADRKMVGRLTAAVLRVIQTDLTSERGLRTVTKGEVAFLNGFDFNEDAKMGTTFFVPVVTAVDRANGRLSLSIPTFIPNDMINKPLGATHFRLRVSGAEIDFEGLASTATMTETADTLLSRDPFPATTMEVQLPAASVHPLFLAFAIEFTQEVNGKKYPLNTGKFTGVSIVAADKVPA